jgi:hypothetical protein
MAKVTVGCKLPHGIWMELVTPHPLEKSTLPLPRDKRAIRLNGASSVRIARTNPIDHAFGITLVDAEYAAEWFKRNKDAEFVVNNLIFLVDTVDEKNVKAAIKDHAKEKTGLEPINPDGDSRAAHGVTTNKEGGAIAGQAKQEPIFGRPS